MAETKSASLTVLGGPLAGTRCVLPESGTVTLGSAPGSGLRLDLPELVLRLLERGDKVAGYPFDGYWLDIGRHSDYQKALDDYEQMKHALLAPSEAMR